jgi:hypothetical protein
VLDGALDLEDQAPLGTAKVEVAPVHALVQRRVRCDRELRLGGGLYVQVGELHLQPAELHALVGDDRPGQRDRRLGGQRGDLAVEFPGGLALGGDDLNEARFVAHDHELHALLVAHGLHPATQLDLFAHGLGQLRDRRSLHVRRDPLRASPAGPYCPGLSSASSTSTSN